MNLFCQPCNALHRLTAGEVERALYALVAVHSDETTEDRADCRPFAGEDSASHVPCLLAVMDWSGEPEMYREFVDAGVEARRSLSAAAPVQSGGAP